MSAALLQEAIALRRTGKIAEAAAIYKNILQADPLNFEALHALGIVAYQCGQLEDAARLMGDAVAVNPHAPDASYNRACVLMKLNRPEEALASFDAALARKPDYLEALVNRANVLRLLGRHADSLANLDQVVALKPNIAEVWNNRAGALAALGRNEDALSSYDRAVAIRPDYLDAWKGRAAVLISLERRDEALIDFDKALALAPMDTDLLSRRADLSLLLNRNEEAASYYERYLVLKPNEAMGWYCRGVALHRQRRLMEALGCFDKALGLETHLFAARCARADLLFELERFEDVAQDYETVLAYDPNCPAYVRGYLTLSKLHCCDWTGFEERRAKIAADIALGQFVLDPLGYAVMSESPAEQRQCAKIWRQRALYQESPALWQGERYRHDKIRVAYVSADLRTHATALLMAGVFESHDTSRFDTVAISTGADDKSPMRQRLEAAFGEFIDARGRTDRDVADMMRAMEIDIAVDLKGYTAEGRPGIFAFRPAPVQAHYLGYPGTTAADYYDYLIADLIVVPPEQRRHYSEKLAYLPDTYQCNDRNREVAARTPSRAELGLPERGFVYCCFNNDHKILPTMFDIWMRLLRAVDGSVLWLLQDNPAVARNLRREAESRGVAGERIVFAQRTSPAEHLARQKCAELFLDTLPYNAHTTASDALWVGLPVLTAPGATFASRVAASLLNAAGLPELAVPSLAEYEALALELAREPSNLAAIKAKLARNRDVCALFDTARFTRNLETVYTTMWEQAQRGDAPESFAVADGKAAPVPS